MGAKQKLFLDGIRHAAEVADCAYRRLIELLTHIVATRDEDRPGESLLYTEAFLYAWALVDAADRFRALVQMLPGLSGGKDLLSKILSEGFGDLRKLRNAADHIAQKADFYVAQNAAALGTLSWLTRLGKDSIASCAIRPGTVPQSAKFTMVAPNENPPVEGTRYVYLQVGKLQICLCDVLTTITSHVRGIEHLVAEGLIRRSVEPGSGENRDVLVIATIRIENAN